MARTRYTLRVFCAKRGVHLPGFELTRIADRAEHAQRVARDGPSCLRGFRRRDLDRRHCLIE
jgi:hypothetical protein